MKKQVNKKINST